MQTFALAVLSYGLISASTVSLPIVDARSPTIAAFVDDQTIAVVRVDAQRVDVSNMKQLLQTLSSGHDPQGKHAEALLSWIPPFVKAGGKELYIVVNLADLSHGTKFMIAPVPDGVNATAIMDSLAKMPLKDEVREQLGSAIFVGSKQILARLKLAKPVPRKELSAALEAGGEAPLQVLLLPTAENRRVIEELLPTLPPELGGGSIKILTRGVMWAALAIEAQPSTMVRLVLQSEDAGKAKDLGEFFNTNLSRIAKFPEANAFLPGIAAIVNTVHATVAGDRVSLNLEGSKMIEVLQPVARKLHERADMSTMMDHFKQIGFALHSYFDVNKAFPAVASYDSQGKPLLSWRVHLLPFLGEKELYKEFHLNEPWDSEHNKKLVARIPKVFVVPGLAGSDTGLTTILAPVAANAMWTGTAKTVRLQDVTDGTSNTIFVVDAADKLAVPWTKPGDYEYDPKDPAAGLAFRSDGNAAVSFADGSARGLPKTLDAKTFLALFTRNGGEVVNY